MTVNFTHQFRQKLRNRDLLFGTFLKIPSRYVTEVLAQSSLDCLCIDTEHSPFDRSDIDNAIFACQHYAMPSIVRVQTLQSHHILNAFDCGASAVLVPHIKSAEDAQKVVDYSIYGRERGYAGSTRFANYGGYPLTENLKRNASDNAIIVQIEDVEAVDNIDTICQVERIDAIFIGSMDLTVAYGATKPSDAVVVDAMNTIIKTANRHNMPIGIFIADLKLIPTLIEQQVSFFLRIFTNK